MKRFGGCSASLTEKKWKRKERGSILAERRPCQARRKFKEPYQRCDRTQGLQGNKVILISLARRQILGQKFYVQCSAQSNCCVPDDQIDCRRLMGLMMQACVFICCSDLLSDFPPRIQVLARDSGSGGFELALLPQSRDLLCWLKCVLKYHPYPDITRTKARVFWCHVGRLFLTASFQNKTISSFLTYRQQRSQSTKFRTPF